MKTVKIKMEKRIPKIGEIVVGIIPEIAIPGLPKCPEFIRIGKVVNNTEFHHDSLVIDLWRNINEVTGETTKLDPVFNTSFPGGTANAFLYAYQITPIWN